MIRAATIAHRPAAARYWRLHEAPPNFDYRPISRACEWNDGPRLRNPYEAVEVTLVDQDGHPISVESIRVAPDPPDDAIIRIERSVDRLSIEIWSTTRPTIGGTWEPAPITRTIRVNGTPIPQGSKNHVGNGRLIESAAGLPHWRALIANTAHAAHRGLMTAPYAVDLEFVMPRPKSTPKNRPTPPAIKRPDIDKLERAVLDALTDVWFADDAQVIEVHKTKRIAEHGEQPGVTITARETTTVRPK